MADLNSNSSSSPLPPPSSFALESDDISILLHTLLQSSTLPSSSASLDAPPHLEHQQRPPSASEEIRRQFCGSSGFPDYLNFSSRGGYYHESERCRNAVSSAIVSSAEGIGEFDCESEKDQDVSEAPRDSGPPRSSNKRTRAAEIHNLSEKRRRQKINEKMKALQKLIPNCNKTDKASMLDEAIEYLKQLQLQVQMLALRNGSALHPFYLPGVMNSSQPTASGISFNGGDGLPSCSRGTGPLYADQKIPIQAVFNPSSRCASSDQKMYMPVVLGTGNSECPSVLEPSTSTYCRPFNFETSSKDLYGDSKLDVGCCGYESSSVAFAAIDQLEGSSYLSPFFKENGLIWKVLNARGPLI